jgi:hypothetical protein
VVRSIRHRGLKRLHEDDDPRGVIAEHVVKLGDILARLDAPVRCPIWIYLVSGYISSKVSSKVSGP